MRRLKRRGEEVIYLFVLIGLVRTEMSSRNHDMALDLSLLCASLVSAAMYYMHISKSFLQRFHFHLSFALYIT